MSFWLLTGVLKQLTMPGLGVPHNPLRPSRTSRIRGVRTFNSATRSRIERLVLTLAIPLVAICLTAPDASAQTPTTPTVKTSSSGTSASGTAASGTAASGTAASGTSASDTTASGASGSGTTASGTTATAAPAQLSFVADSPVLTFHQAGTATTTVQVVNPGPAVPVSFDLVLLPGARAVPANPAWVSQCPGSSGLNTVTLTFRTAFDTSLTGASIVVSPSNTAATTSPAHKHSLCPSSPTTPATPEAQQAQAISLTLHRDTSTVIDFLLPLGTGLLCAAIFYLCVRTPAKAHAVVRAGSSWNFKDSWATNITTAGAIGGTFLTAVGASSTLLPGIQTSSFALLIAIWGAVIVLAPLVFTLVPTAGADPGGEDHPGAGNDPQAGHPGGAHPGGAGHVPRAGHPPEADAAADDAKKWTRVKVGLLLAAACMTLIGVAAELATAGVMIHYATTTALGLWASWVGLGVVGLAILVYAVRSTRTLIETSHDGEPRSMLHAGTDTSLLL